VIVFGLEIVTDGDGYQWLHIADGWLLAGREEGLTFEAQTYADRFIPQRGESSFRSSSRARPSLASTHRKLLPESTSAPPTRMTSGVAAQSDLKKSTTGLREHFESPRAAASVSRFHVAEMADDDPVLHKLASLEEELFCMSSHLQQFHDRLVVTQEIIGLVRAGMLCKVQCDIC